MPDLDRQERIRSHGGIVLGVSIDEDCQSFEHFLKEHPVAFQTTCESTNKRVSLDYGTSLITSLTDKDALPAKLSARSSGIQQR